VSKYLSNKALQITTILWKDSSFWEFIWEGKRIW